MAATSFDAFSGKRLPVVDIRRKVRTWTALSPPADGEAAAFRGLTRHLLPNFTYDQKCPPPSEGAVIGTYFNPNIIGFNDRTAIHWRVVAPQFLGGKSRDRLFLTSSNQASRGPEALVRYENHTEAVFRVWDWAHPEDPDPEIGRFVVAIPHSRWKNHEVSFVVNGVACTGLQIKNETRSLGSRQWINEVFLFNHVSGTLDLIWQYKHMWDVNEGCKFLFFGPCIEAKGSGYDVTNSIGYEGGTLDNDVVGVEKLIANNSRLVERAGFEIDRKHLQANHTMLAD